jgi:N6-L-threonylcarbamoyladenine synthase
VLILALESSCDENSAALIEDGALLGVCTKTQTVHQQFGGVVPELAGRSHLELVDLLVEQVLLESGREAGQINLVAATIGPGLIGSLLVASSYGRGLAAALNCPFRSVHHVEAHLWSAELTCAMLPLPFLVLLVSGGHSLIVLVSGLRDYRILGTTLDDALGEAYDKVGKLVGLKFPAGADVDRLARDGTLGNHIFTTPLNDESLNFSFSGLKTSFLYRIKPMTDAERDANRADLLAAFQDAALTSVAMKMEKAVVRYQPRAIVAAGGVAANSCLRGKLDGLGNKYAVPCHYPALQYCGDNAAMIGYLAWKMDLEGCPIEDKDSPRPRWPLDALPRISRSA